MEKEGLESPKKFPLVLLLLIDMPKERRRVGRD